METRVEKLKTVCTENEVTELVTLYNAYVLNLKKLNDDQSAVNTRNFDASKKVLSETVGMLEAKYFDDAEPFKDRKAVADYLQREGYKVSQQKVYKDAKNRKLKVQPDKTVRQVDVKEYIILAGLEKVVDESGDISDEVKEKAKADVALTKAREKKINYELDQLMGKYLLKTDVEAAAAQKIGAFESQFKNRIRIKAEDIIFAVGGDVAKASVFRNMMYGYIDDLLEEMGKLEELNITIRKRRYPEMDLAS